MTPGEHRVEAERLLAQAAERVVDTDPPSPLHTQQVLRDRVLTEHDLRAALVHAVLATTPTIPPRPDRSR